MSNEKNIKEKLTPLQYKVTQEKGTEPPVDEENADSENISESTNEQSENELPEQMGTVADENDSTIYECRKTVSLPIIKSLHT